MTAPVVVVVLLQILLYLILALVAFLNHALASEALSKGVLYIFGSVNKREK